MLASVGVDVARRGCGGWGCPPPLPLVCFLAPYIGKCRYTGCTHLKEDGCAVLSAVRAGAIAPTRHRSYCELYAILKEKPVWGKK